MSFNLDGFGNLTTTEARERALTGWVAGTVDLDHTLDSTGSFESTITFNDLLHLMGVHFDSPDNSISIFSDGSIEAFEFLEGARVYLDSSARLTVVQLQESN